MVILKKGKVGFMKMGNAKFEVDELKKHIENIEKDNRLNEKKYADGLTMDEWLMAQGINPAGTLNNDKNDIKQNLNHKNENDAFVNNNLNKSNANKKAVDANKEIDMSNLYKYVTTNGLSKEEWLMTQGINPVDEIYPDDDNLFDR